MLFSGLEDLIAYLYVLYESMRMDLTMQFDLLPISIRKNEHSGGLEKQPENLLECSLDTFPDVAANYQSKDNKELFERESIALCPVDTSQQNEALDRSVTA